MVIAMNNVYAVETPLGFGKCGFGAYTFGNCFEEIAEIIEEIAQGGGGIIGGNRECISYGGLLGTCYYYDIITGLCIKGCPINKVCENNKCTDIKVQDIVNIPSTKIIKTLDYNQFPELIFNFFNEKFPDILMKLAIIIGNILNNLQENINIVLDKIINNAQNLGDKPIETTPIIEFQEE